MGFRPGSSGLPLRHHGPVRRRAGGRVDVTSLVLLVLLGAVFAVPLGVWAVRGEWRAMAVLVLLVTAFVAGARRARRPE